MATVIGEERTCVQCGASFWARPSDDRKVKGGKRFLCGNACRYEWQHGSGNPNWRGGRIVSAGYIYVHTPDHPHATQDGYVMEHRLVMEASIGRHLSPEEVVHHRNEVKSDNRIENLHLVGSGSEHRILHGDWQDVPCAWCGTPVRRCASQRRRYRRSYCGRHCAALAGSAAASKKARDLRESA